MQERKLQFVEGSSSKFWHATLQDSSVTVCFGRIGTSGQTQEKAFGSAEEAKKSFDKQVAEKLKKGYRDQSEAEAASAPSPAASAKSPKPKPAQPAAAPLAPPATIAPEANVESASEPAPRSDDAAPLRAAAGRAAFQRPPVRVRVSDEERARVRCELGPPLPWPEVEAFDQERCLAGLAGLGKPTDQYFELSKRHAAIRLSMSRDEARLYLAALQLRGKGNLGRTLKLAAEGKLAPGDDLMSAHGNDNLAILFCRALGLPATLDVMFTHPLNWRSQQVVEPLRRGLVRHLLPYLSETERESLRARLRQHWALHPDARWSVGLLAQLGESADQIAAWVSQWPSATAAHYYDFDNDADTLHALFGLRDPDAIAREAKRLRAPPRSAEDARLLLAATELRCVKLLSDMVVTRRIKADAEPLANALALAEGPENAACMLRVMLESKAPGVGRAWLEQHPEFTAEGLVGLISGQGAEAEAAQEQLRALYRRGLSHCVDAALSGLSEEQQRAVRVKLESKLDVDYPIAQEHELPAWAQQCFGDPAKLVIPAVELSPEQLAPIRRVAVERRVEELPPLPEPVPLPPPQPFDLEACMTLLLGSATAYGGNWWAWDHKLWERPLPLTREEASFWAAAHAFADHRTDPPTLEQKLRTLQFEGKARQRHLPVTLAFVLRGYEGVVQTLWNEADADAVKRALDHVVRYLSHAERAELLQVLLSQKVPSAGAWSLALHMGADKRQLAPAIARMTPAARSGWMSVGLRVLYVLEEPSAIVAEAERLNLLPWDARSALEWLSCTGLAGVPVLVRRILEGGLFEKTDLLRALLLAETPEVVPALLSMRKHASVREPVRRWFDAHPVFAIEGLLALLGTKDKLASAALELLRELARRGFGPLIAQKSGGDPKVQKQVLDPRAGLATPGPADHTLALLLPPLVIRCEQGMRRVGPEHVATLLAELRSSTLGAPTPRLALLREQGDRPSLEALAWALFQGWLSDGAPSKERWKFEALGQLGGDASALQLAALVRQWPGESQHQRAVLGLEVLRAIGSDTALMQIHGISQKVSFKGIKERAAECMDGIAADRGMSRDELADRIIPDAGLAPSGSRVFSFGPRSFTFLLGTDLKPMLRDESGKRSADLPKPNSKDDAELAKQAVADWKLLKKQVAEVAKTQATRLELAMVVGRRWTPDDFQSLFVAHPLMVHLVRRLIWGAYDSEGALSATFRVGDDNSFSDESDQPWELPSTISAVGLVHPSHLDEAQRSAWGELLSDYEIIPPFTQLGRPTFPLTQQERTGKLLKRFSEHDVDPKVLVFGLDAMGWQRGQPQDGGGFCVHHKSFGEVTAVVTYREGCWAGSSGDEWKRQTIEALGFLREPGAAQDGFFSWSSDAEQALPLAEIDPVISSEALYDVTRLYERGKPA